MLSLPQESCRLADLHQDRPEPFELRPETQEMAAIAADLKLDGLRKLWFSGTLDWISGDELRLNGYLRAMVTQPCVVTLTPVTTHIEADVVRRFVTDMPEPSGKDEEMEMPEDDSLEPLTPTIDLAQVMVHGLHYLCELSAVHDGRLLSLSTLN